MKHISFKSLILGTAMMVAGTGMAAAQANDTAAGSIVSNTITLSFNGATNGGTATRIDLPETAGMTETFTVAQKIDLSVTANQADQQLGVLPGTEAAQVSFTLTNLGNAKSPTVAEQDFHINVGNSGTLAGGDPLAELTYSATVTTTPGTYYVTVNGAAYDVANATAIALAPDADATIVVVANIPGTSVDTLADVFTVTAFPVDGSGDKLAEVPFSDLDTLAIVYADAASTSAMANGTAALDAALNGDAKAETRIIVTAPQLSATKTAVVLDEGLPGSTFDCAVGGTATGAGLAPIPGACVEYTITVTNDAAATAPATAITITDVLPAGTAFAGKTDGDFAPVTEASGTVTATLATLAAGESGSFQIRVTVE
jgi:uncharacterized repeat protein (TIGR01451 family)